MLPPGDEATYAELGIGKMQASRWQALAKTPVAIFEAVIGAHGRQSAPPITASVLRAAARADFDLDPASNDIAQITVRARRYSPRKTTV